jgi:hypothetical protein
MPVSTHIHQWQLSAPKDDIPQAQMASLPIEERLTQMIRRNRDILHRLHSHCGSSNLLVSALCSASGIITKVMEINKYKNGE